MKNNIVVGNNGRSKAKIISVENGFVTLKMLTGKRKQTWKLSEKYFRSSICGWKPERK